MQEEKDKDGGPPRPANSLDAGQFSTGKTLLIDDALLAQVHLNMGQVYMDRRRWRKASLYFVMCKQTDKLAECLFQMGDFDTLKNLRAHLPGNSPVHAELAGKYESIGLCEDAVECYVQVSTHTAAGCFRPRRRCEVPFLAMRSVVKSRRCQQNLHLL